MTFSALLTGAKGAGVFVSKMFTGGVSKTGLIASSFSTNFVGVTKALIRGEEAIDSFKGTDWAKYILAGGIMATGTVASLSNFLSDSRRLREIFSEQSNFYTSREAAQNSWYLSTGGLVASSLVAVTGLAGFKSLPVKIATTGLSIAGVGSLLARNIYKYFTIDAPFKPNSNLGLLSFNKPVLRVTDPSSPYYMMSDLMEGAVNKRIHDDAQYGKLGGGYYEAIEKGVKNFSHYITA
jgi:hypothetical protein